MGARPRATCAKAGEVRSFSAFCFQHKVGIKVKVGEKNVESSESSRVDKGLTQKKFLTFCRIRRIPTDLLIQWPPNLATTASLIPRSWRRAVGRPHRSINSAHSIHISALFSFYSSRPHAPKGDDDLSSVADIQFGTRSYPPLPRAIAIIACFFYCANKTCSSDCSFADNLWRNYD